MGQGLAVNQAARGVEHRGVTVHPAFGRSALQDSTDINIRRPRDRSRSASRGTSGSGVGRFRACPNRGWCLLRQAGSQRADSDGEVDHNSL